MATLDQPSERESALPAQARRELKRILSSRAFEPAPRLSRFLRYVTERALNGDIENLKEYAIGLEVFDRGASFDPRVDTIVRVQARRLRQRLEKYYSEEGAGARLRIEVPKGSYVPILAAAPVKGPRNGDAPPAARTPPHEGYDSHAPEEALNHLGESKPGEQSSASRRSVLLLVATAMAGVTVMAGYFWSRPPTGLSPDQLVETAVTRYRGGEMYPSFSPDGSQVAYSAQRDGGAWNIFVEVVGSHRPRRLTSSRQDDVAPAWSPDGRFLAFVRKGASETETQLYVLPAGGGAERKVLDFERRGDGFVAVSWTPDGEGLVFSARSGSDGPARLGLISIRGGEPRWLTTPERHLIGDAMPSLSRDGSQLVFVRCEGMTSGQNLYLLSLSPGYQPLHDPKQLTHFDRQAVAPAWGPDGNEILFLGERGPGQEGLWSVHVSGAEEPRLVWRRTALMSNATGLAVGRTATGKLQVAYSVASPADSDIYRMALVGREKGKLVPFIATAEQELGAKYSPDGRWVAYKAGDPVLEVWICDLNGSNKRQLTTLGSRIMGPIAWSPDSKTITFHARPVGAAKIYVVNVDTGNTQAVTDDPADDAIPTYSRDGKWIYFTSTRNGEWAVWRVPAGGGEPRLVTNRRCRTIQESWDGALLYCNDPKTGDIWRLPAPGQPARPTAVVRGATTRIGGIQVTRSGVYWVSKSGSLNRYDIGREAVEELFFVGRMHPGVQFPRDIHADETSALVNVSRLPESDLNMLEEQ